MSTRQCVSYFVLSCIISSFLISGTAAASSGDSEGSVEYCTVLIGQVSGSDYAQVLGRACSDHSIEKSKIRLSSTIESSHASAVPMGSELMYWYEGANFQGNRTLIVGDGRTCDSQGCRLDAGSWAKKISSARGVGLCTRARFFNINNTYAREDLLPVRYLDNRLNDNVGMIRVWNG